MASIGVCLETFFTDLDYRSRMERVRASGFTRYEFWFHDKRFDGSRLFNEPKDFSMIAEMDAKLGMTCTDFIFNHRTRESWRPSSTRTTGRASSTASRA